MSGPYAENSIVMDIETGQVEPCLQFEPDGLPGDQWLHRRVEFEVDLDHAGVIDRYALPESNEYEVRIVEVPPGEELRLGDVAALHGRSGGGDLVEVLGRDSIPKEWVNNVILLSDYIE
ncbi:hypothetical protein SAMN05216559_1825 [Halomicrobium zhouii]|uniref:Uncharacterized protein n=1 Tax=Halomicrobium zhouii TaxID=767519 RepID=A0A1I6L1E6_9EURY|nr:hypothetical protein [Halomicrobium zhouii]SFR97284.1 hypothetical protein SAMN05216559_1825 [Halomicrobium zhouii]